MLKFVRPSLARGGRQRPVQGGSHRPLAIFMGREQPLDAYREDIRFLD